MRLKLSSAFLRSMLSSHSILGLTAAALLYLVSVTGTMSVLYPQLERWEQPQIEERKSFDPTTINAAVTEVLRRESTRPQHVYITLPTDDSPRLAIESGATNAYILADGSLGQRVDHQWTHFLVELHYALTLPGVLGFTLVGVLGVMMTALLISGILAHANIFKDAFSFRVSGAKRLQQVDIHNRLSVWTSPFQLAIAMTGAFIGLSQVFSWIIASAFFGGDMEAATRSLFLQHDKPTQIAAPLPDVAAVLERFRTEHSDRQPMLVTVHEPGTTAQAIEISARVPHRLVWSEFYQYDESERRFERAGWSDGDVGMQLYASTYRLHFGNFAGVPMQLAYIAFGVALCFIIATGVNIWLLRRAQLGRPADLAQVLWATTVWGVPFALALSALGDVAFELNGVGCFWITLLAFLGGAALVKDVAAWSWRLRCATAGASIGIVVAHGIRFGLDAASEAALLVNVLWLVLAGSLMASLRKRASVPHEISRSLDALQSTERV